MKSVLVFLTLAILLFGFTESGTQCPFLKSSAECSCSSREDGLTIVLCQRIHNTSHLEEATKPLKSLVVDRLMLFDAFPNYSDPLDVLESMIEPKNRTYPTNGIFPRRWLSELRVRDIEVQNAEFNGFFMTEDAFEGQADFLTSIVVKNANLKGHVCASCAPGYFSVSTKALRRLPLLSRVDFSSNRLEVLDGTVFPTNLRHLSRVKLSNNQIYRIHDNAFAGLQLNYLDLSRNRLTSISRRIFRAVDSALNSLDLSYNAIQALPEDMFASMNGLKEVKLGYNLIETLPSTTWSRAPALLEKIDLRGNFLVCNCTMNWMSRRLSKNTKMFGRCIGPKEVEFQELRASLPTVLLPC